MLYSLEAVDYYGFLPLLIGNVVVIITCLVGGPHRWSRILCGAFMTLSAAFLAILVLSAAANFKTLGMAAPLMLVALVTIGAELAILVPLWFKRSHKRHRLH